LDVETGEGSLPRMPKRKIVGTPKLSQPIVIGMKMAWNLRFLLRINTNKSAASTMTLSFLTYGPITQRPEETQSSGQKAIVRTTY
jgi:hypothetical protein